MKKIILSTVGIVVIIEVLALIVWVNSGAVDVSAAKPEGGLSSWFLTSVKDRSVRSRAAEIVAPSLDDTLLVMKGFDHYNEMCVSCHGAPGKDPEELAKGLNPPAPLLTHSVGKWNAAETFVIIKNGIKMTGMPAWGTTHDDSALWAMVAFVRRLPTITPEEYKKFETEGSMEEGKEEHHHDDHEHEH